LCFQFSCDKKGLHNPNLLTHPILKPGVEMRA
jgi:hypothetical protein